LEKILGIHSNFLGAETTPSTWKNSRVAILPVPFEQTVSYGRGTARGPAAILRASAYVEFYDEETGRDVMAETGIATLPPLRTAGRKGGAALGQIRDRAEGIVGSGKFLVALGGEHTITSALVRAHLGRWPGLSILQIDAHSDLRESYQGSPWSHASVMARVCEFVDPRRIVQVGIRAQCREEADFIRSRGITTLYAHRLREGRPGAWMDRAISKLSKHVYVTFDVDGLDPAVMPATGTPEPNGLGWDETMRFLRRLASRRTVVGCDVVEFSPLRGLHHADLTAAKLVSKMINYFVR
jgi:agmatinase